MRNLFLFLYRYRAFIIFVLLEVLCGWLIVRNNYYQGAAYFNSANALTANTLQFSNNVSEYFNLRTVNEELVTENSILKKQVSKLRQNLTKDSLPGNNFLFKNFEYIPAKIINNSTQNFNNYITLNKGSKDGVEPGMGVVTSDGVVGKVKATSDHFATVISFLHSNYFVSAKIRRTQTLCSMYWNGVNPRKANLLYVPRHIKLQKGDTIITSGFNAIFPEDIVVGQITDFSIKENEEFYEVEMELNTDYSSLSYVYIIKNLLRVEIDSLEMETEVLDE